MPSLLCRCQRIKTFGMEAVFMNKNAIKTIISCIITICLLIISLKYLTDLFERKQSNTKYEPFFSQEEEFDVLFMGTSHVINAIFPMELWKDYGIVSYNFGGHANPLPTTYWVMKNALDYTTPKLMVIDCYHLSYNQKLPSPLSYLHISLDSFPLSSTKLCAVSDLFTDDREKNDEKDINKEKGESSLTLLWDYSIYHSRWDELTESDFELSPTVEKGAESRDSIGIPNEVLSISSDVKLTDETTGVKYLCKMIEDCQQHNIEVLLIYLPFPASEVPQMEANRVYDIAEEYDVHYINFLDMDIIDYNTDCYDSNSHLNPSGARKITDYLGQYITRNYDIPDRRMEVAYQDWHDAYKKYNAFKQNNIRNTEALDIYLMLLADKNYDSTIEIYNPAILQNVYYVQLLNNIRPGEECYTVLFKEDADCDIRITVTDNNTNETIDEVSFSIQTQADMDPNSIVVTEVNR